MQIKLTKGFVTEIDEEDADLAEFNWRYNALYAGRTIGYIPRKTILLHRVILSRVLDRELLRNEFVDHKDGDRLNNTRSNLRLATNSQNLMNTGICITNTSGFKGVSWNAQNSKWIAQIRIDGKTTYLGQFATAEAASAVYQAKARELFGEFYRET